MQKAAQMLRCADGKMLYMTKRFSVTLDDEDYETLRAVAYACKKQPAVQARNLMLTQLRIERGGDADQDMGFPAAVEYLRATGGGYLCFLPRGHASDHDYASTIEENSYARMLAGHALLCPYPLGDREPGNGACD